MADIVFPQRYLDINVRLGRRVTYAASPARVQALVAIRPVAQGPLCAPVDLRLVVDRSGSMADHVGECAAALTPSTKILLARRALASAAQVLEARDMAMLVSFSDSGRLDVEHRAMGSDGRAVLMCAIDYLAASGGTHISDSLEVALLPARRDGLVPGVVLFTDGESTISSANDHRRLAELADVAREHAVPLCIYATGDSYNWSLLQQLAARAGGGSFCKHVTDVAQLGGHLLGEIAFMRGVAVDGLCVHGQAAEGVELVSVTAMSPLMRRLEVQQPGHEQADFASLAEFRDSSGCLDIARGQHYLIEADVRNPVPGETVLLNIELECRVLATSLPVRETVAVSATFTPDKDKEDALDEEVYKVCLMVAAAQQANAGNYAGSATLYEKAGDPTTAQAMRRMGQTTHRSGEGARRAAYTIVSSVVMGHFTIVPDSKGGTHQ